MKKTIVIVLVLLLALVAVLVVRNEQPSSLTLQSESAEHIYATWDIMEFDKCVAAWLIIRFIDKDAEFVFYPQGAEIKEGIVFDVPGAAWSRKHRKCTSDCILESIDINDSAVEKIVSFAHQTELNFWQLEQFPEARECFDEVREITDKADNLSECFESTRPYFDNLYNNLRKEQK